MTTFSIGCRVQLTAARAADYVILSQRGDIAGKCYKVGRLYIHWITDGRVWMKNRRADLTVIVEQPDPPAAPQGAYSLSEAELDEYVRSARWLLDSAGYRGIGVDRCRHATVSELALWIFDASDIQIGVVALLDPAADTYRANRMLFGMPTSERRFDSLRLALLHVVESR